MGNVLCVSSILSRGCGMISTLCIRHHSGSGILVVCVGIMWNNGVRNDNGPFFFFFFDLFIYPEESRYMMNGFRLSPAVGLAFP